MSERKFLVLLRSQPSSNAPKTQPSPEQMQAMLAAYGAWKEKFKAEILDMGDKLKPDGRVLKAGSVTDGPFVEAKELIGGYMIVTGADYDAAVAVVQACPASQMPGVSLEIRELGGAKM